MCLGRLRRQVLGSLEGFPSRPAPFLHRDATDSLKNYTVTTGGRKPVLLADSMAIGPELMLGIEKNV